MIIDLTDCIVRYDKNQDLDTIASDTTSTRITQLTKEKRVIVFVAEGLKTVSCDFTYSHFDSKIYKSIKLHADTDTFMVSLSKLAGPCFVVYNKNLCEKNYIINI